MARKTVTVKPSAKAAASLKIKLARYRGATASAAVVKVANAEPFDTGTARFAHRTTS